MNLKKLHDALLLVETMIDYGDAPTGLMAVRDILEDLYIGADDSTEVHQHTVSRQPSFGE